jgi:DNA-binding response OmpR family regulator
MRSLVIEDEPQIGAYLGRLLGQFNGIVDIVGSLSDAQQALGNFKYDLAIVDRMLPDGDALDIVAALSQLPERPAIIMLTAKDAKEDVVDGLNRGARACLSSCRFVRSGARAGTWSRRVARSARPDRRSHDDGAVHS